jgi:hypothetical protein
MDALASLKLENKVHLVALDWKTTNALWPEFALQIAAYAKAYEEIYGEHIDQAYLVPIFVFLFLPVRMIKTSVFSDGMY